MEVSPGSHTKLLPVQLKCKTGAPEYVFGKNMPTHRHSTAQVLELVSVFRNGLNKYPKCFM